MIRKKENDSLEIYSKDASNYSSMPDEVIIPESEHEFIDTATQCFENKIPITIAGARTGLTGGAVANEGILISTEKLNKVIKIDSNRQTATIQPGVTVIQLQEELDKSGFFYPPNPTETLSTIGGNIATNASGSRTFRYGPTREFVKRLKILLSDGKIIEIKRGELYAKGTNLVIPCESGNLNIKLPRLKMPKVKNASGYYLRENMDAIDLFIGSEGTLGIIIEAEISFERKPEEIIGLVVFFKNKAELFNVLDNLKLNIIPGIRLIEYFDEKCLKIMKHSKIKIPGMAIHAFWIEVETNNVNIEGIISKFYHFLEDNISLADSTFAALTPSENHKLKEMRHSVPLFVNDKVSKLGIVKLATDSAVPGKYFKDYFSFIKSEAVNSKLEYFIYGHIGNSHLHCNLFYSNDIEYSKAEKARNEILKQAVKLGGTVSAEHGIGKIKREFLIEMYGRAAIEDMIGIKETFDPEWLLGRGNLFISS